VRRGLNHPAAQEVLGGVEEVRGDGEQPPERDGLLPEDRQGQRIAVFAVAADELGGLVLRQAGELVVVILGEPVRQQVLLDAGERGDAFRIAPLTAVTCGHRLAGIQQAVHRDGDVAELSGHPGCPLDHPPGLDEPAAQPGAHDRGDRAIPPGIPAEPYVVRVQSSRIAVVVVDNGKPEAFGQRGPDVEAAPAGVPEVGGALR
jgi:hypothetical protein